MVDLLRPLEDGNILVPNERVYYAARQHWVSVAQPVYETFVFLLLVVFLVGLVNNRGNMNGWIKLLGGLLAFAAVHAVLQAASGHNPVSSFGVDPFAPPHQQPSKFTRVAVVAVVALIGLRIGIQAAGIVAVIVVVTRLAMILAQWAFYERRYITNRRLIEAGGFLGTRINSMPLSRVTDISFSRTPTALFFGYAKMRIETAGQQQALGVVRFITDPEHFYEVLVNFSAPHSSTAPKE